MSEWTKGRKEGKNQSMDRWKESMDGWMERKRMNGRKE